MSLVSVVHRLIDVAAGLDRIGEHEVGALHDAADGVEPVAPVEPPPPPTAEEIAAFRAWQAGSGAPADA